MLGTAGEAEKLLHMDTVLTNQQRPTSALCRHWMQSRGLAKNDDPIGTDNKREARESVQSA